MFFSRQSNCNNEDQIRIAAENHLRQKQMIQYARLQLANGMRAIYRNDDRYSDLDQLPGHLETFINLFASEYEKEFCMLIAEVRKVVESYSEQVLWQMKEVISDKCNYQDEINCRKFQPCLDAVEKLLDCCPNDVERIWLLGLALGINYSDCCSSFQSIEIFKHLKNDAAERMELLLVKMRTAWELFNVYPVG